MEKLSKNIENDERKLDQNLKASRMKENKTSSKEEKKQQQQQQKIK